MNYSSVQELSEEELIVSAQENPENFKLIYEQHFAAIFGFILKRVNDQEITADITQQVFLKGLTNINKFKYQGLPYSAYLYRIAINECNSYFRENDKTRYVTIEERVIENFSNEIKPDNDYELELPKLKNALLKIKPNEVELLELRFFEQCSFKEVGYFFKITENSAKVKTYRLLNKLKKIMSNEII